MIELIQEQVKQVALARKRAALAKQHKEEAYRLWQEQNKELLQEENFASLALSEMEGKLREMAVQDYLQTGNKNPAPGVSIKLMTRLQYNLAEALAWATEHNLALKLDTQAFEKVAKASPLPFVQQGEIPQAFIASNLEER